MHHESGGYENEPREQFDPLPPHLHSLYYHYERFSGDLEGEVSFYRAQFAGRCHRILDLGCGTSIISSRLAAHGAQVTGIDLCRDMLAFRPHLPANSKVQMDMRQLGFRRYFDGALIAHNTLNLLVQKSAIKHCLSELRSILIPPGIVVVHLHVADQGDKADGEQRRLQFQIFELPTGEKIVKESITSHDYSGSTLLVEQRYKYRNFLHPLQNRNYRQVLELASFSADTWFEIICESGFNPIASTSKFSRHQPDSATTLVVTAKADF